MRKSAIACVIALCLTGASTAHAQDNPPTGEITEAVEAQATVTAIDLNTRKVTLKGPEGKETTLQVDQRARNLSQVKVGDVVKIAYVQHVAWRVRKPGEGAPTGEAQVE